jgi:toxin-antitoxin system PIN domain toxin
VLCPDVNVLVNAFRIDAPDHQPCRTWLETVVNGLADFAVIPNVLSGFLRVVTHPRVFLQPSALDEALGFCQALIDSGRAQWIGPASRHWQIFSSLCRNADARGNLIPDAWFAAVAIENSCEWVTLDRDYARFPGLRWSLPA